MSGSFQRFGFGVVRVVSHKRRAGERCAARTAGIATVGPPHGGHANTRGESRLALVLHSPMSIFNRSSMSSPHPMQGSLLAAGKFGICRCTPYPPDFPSHGVGRERRKRKGEELSKRGMQTMHFGDVDGPLLLFQMDVGILAATPQKHRRWPRLATGGKGGRDMSNKEMSNPSEGT